ncbi:MAG: PDZ domain-containing protein, partial [Acidobacteriota bacterium]
TKDLATTPATPSDAVLRVGNLALGVARSWSNAVTATSGIIAVIGGPLPTGPGQSIDRVIRTNAPMHSGFAGGALVDVDGRLTGIATAAEIRGLGVVIPVDIAWKTAASLAEHGTLQRGYLGLAGQSVEVPERHRDVGGQTHALLVSAVSAASPADTGGILVGDVILTFDGHAVHSPVDLLELLRHDRVGRTVVVRVIRGGVAQDVHVTVGARVQQ